MTDITEYQLLLCKYPYGEFIKILSFFRNKTIKNRRWDILKIKFSSKVHRYEFDGTTFKEDTNVSQYKLPDINLPQENIISFISHRNCSNKYKTVSFDHTLYEKQILNNIGKFSDENDEKVIFSRFNLSDQYLPAYHKSDCSRILIPDLNDVVISYLNECYSVCFQLNENIATDFFKTELSHEYIEKFLMKDPFTILFINQDPNNFGIFHEFQKHLLYAFI